MDPVAQMFDQVIEASMAHTKARRALAAFKARDEPIPPERVETLAEYDAYVTALEDHAAESKERAAEHAITRDHLKRLESDLSEMIPPEVWIKHTYQGRLFAIGLAASNIAAYPPGSLNYSVEIVLLPKGTKFATYDLPSLDHRYPQWVYSEDHLEHLRNLNGKGVAISQH